MIMFRSASKTYTILASTYRDFSLTILLARYLAQSMLQPHYYAYPGNYLPSTLE